MSDDSADEASDERSTAGDPFDQFDQHRDREGDPFASLDDDATRESDPAGPAGESPGAATDGDDSDDGPAKRGPEAGDDPFEYADDATASVPDAGTGPGEADPFAGVDVPEGDPFDASAGAFEQAGVEGIDPDSVWDRLTGEGERDGDDERSAPDPGDDPDVVEVSKHSYCEGCPHFSAPPDVACGHEGTEILEFVDVDTVRVANCPVVEERRELEDDV